MLQEHSGVGEASKSTFKNSSGHASTNVGCHITLLSFILSVPLSGPIYNLAHRSIHLRSPIHTHTQHCHSPDRSAVVLSCRREHCLHLARSHREFPMSYRSDLI